MEKINAAIYKMAALVFALIKKHISFESSQIFIHVSRPYNEYLWPELDLMEP